MNNLKKMNNPEKIWTHRLIPEANSVDPDLCPVENRNEETGEFEICKMSLKGAKSIIIKTDFQLGAKFRVWICPKCGSKIFLAGEKWSSPFFGKVFYGEGRLGRICPFCHKDNGMAGAVLVNTKSGKRNGIRCHKCDKWFFAPNAF